MKFDVGEGLTRLEAFGELVKQTVHFSAFRYNARTGIATTTDSKPDPELKTRVLRFQSQGDITFEEIIE